MVQLLDGKRTAADWAKRLQGRFKGVGRLAAVTVGDDAASRLYLEKKAAMAKGLGAGFVLYWLPVSVGTRAVKQKIAQLNRDRRVAGIIVQLPLPKRLDSAEIVNVIAPSKDVDGLTDANISSGGMLPATAVGIIELVRRYKLELRRKQIVLLGFSRLLNVPLALYLSGQGNSITILQKGTRDHSCLRQADVVVSAVGSPKLIRGKDVKPGAIIIDAGIARVGKSVVGDVDRNSVDKRAGWLTPVPGGVGPMTVIALFANLLTAAKTTSQS